MSNLALAGLISGFGEGIKSGADHLTNAFIQSGLMGEREKYEQARQQLVFGHDDTAVANKQTYDKGILQQTQDFTAGQNQAKMGADIVNSTADRVSRDQQHAETEAGANSRNTATEAGATARNTATNNASLTNTREGHRLTNEGNAQTQKSMDERQRVELLNHIEVAKIGASKAMESKMDPATKARIDAQMKKLDIHGEALKNSLDPKEAKTLKNDIETTIQNIDQLVGVEPVQSQTGDPGPITNPFGKTPLERSLERK